MKKINIVLFLFFIFGFGTTEIALFPFYLPTTDQSWLTLAIPEALYLEMKQCPVQICSREITYKKYQELLLKVSIPKSEAIAKIAQEEKADFAVWGILSPSGSDSTNIYLKLIDVFLAKEIYTKVFRFKISNIKEMSHILSTTIITDLGLQSLTQREEFHETSTMPSVQGAYEFLMKGFIFHIGYAKTQNIDSALYFYHRSYAIDSNNFYLLYNLGNLYLEKSDYSSALAFYQKAISLGFTDADLFNNIGIVYLHTDQMDKAYNFLEKAYAIDKNNPSILTNLGMYFLKKQNYINAIQKFNEALNYQPNFLSALYYLSLCYLKISQISKAKELLQLLLDKNIPGVPECEVYLNFAVVNQLLGNYFEAEIYYKKALICKREFKTYVALADLYLIMNEKAKALKTIEDALILNPNDCNLYFRLGELNEALNNRESAIKAYLNFLSLSKDGNKKGETAHRVAKLYYSLGLKNNAEEYFNKAYSYSPRNLSLLRDIGLFYFKEGNFAKAKEFYEMIHNMGHQEVEVFRFLGAIYSYEKDYKNAIEYFKKATGMAPQIGDLWYYLGEQYTHIGEIDSAKKYFHKALDCSFLEEDVRYSLYYNLGIIYQYNNRGERFGSDFDVDKSLYYLEKASAYEPYLESVKQNIMYIEKITGKKVELTGTKITSVVQKKKVLPNLVLVAEFNDREGNGNSILDAEEKAKIAIEVQNNGDGDAGNVEVVARQIDTLNGVIIEKNNFKLTLPAGTKQQINFPIKGDFSLRTGVAKILVEAKETYFGLDSDPIYVVFGTKAIPPPQITLLDVGVKDGIILPGKSAEIHLYLTNSGVGLAQDVYAYIKLPEDVKFITEDSIFYFSHIEPGKQEEIVFEIVPAKRYSAESLTVNLYLKEKHIEFSKSIKVSFPVKRLTKTPREFITTPIIPELAIPMSDVDTAIPLSGEKNPKDFAIIITNKTYSNKTIPPVIFAEKDGEVFKKFLTNIFGISEDRIILKNNATKAELERYFGVKDEYKGYVYRLTKDICDSTSRVFVYYSGHGTGDPETREPYIVPSDADPNFIRQNCYSLKLLMHNLTKLPVKNVFLIVESCFSGMSDGGPIISGISPLIITNVTPIESEKVYCFTATSEQQVAIWNNNAGHGLFTYYLLKGLKGEADTNNDLCLTLGELKKYVTEKVILASKSIRDWYQKPTFTGPENFIMVNYKNK